jgi:hypothetical protein
MQQKIYGGELINETLQGPSYIRLGLASQKNNRII